MKKVDTDVYFNKDDVGKNLYRKKTYYTLCIEQDVIAKDKDEADNKFSDNGIDYSKITKDITILLGPYGTYMKYKGKNIKIQQDIEYTKEYCLGIVNN